MLDGLTSFQQSTFRLETSSSTSSVVLRQFTAHMNITQGHVKYLDFYFEGIYILALFSRSPTHIPVTLQGIQSKPR